MPVIFRILSSANWSGKGPPCFRLQKKLRKKENLACSSSSSFSSDTFSTVTSLPGFQSISVDLISIASLPPRFGNNLKLQYDFSSVLFVKYGFSKKWKTIVKPSLRSSKAKVKSLQYCSTGLSQLWIRVCP